VRNSTGHSNGEYQNKQQKTFRSRGKHIATPFRVIA
jgi:hypothetical protein